MYQRKMERQVEGQKRKTNKPEKNDKEESQSQIRKGEKG